MFIFSTTGGIMAEVLAGLGSLFGAEGLGGLFGAGSGAAGQVATTTPSVMGKGLLQPDILSQVKDLTATDVAKKPDLLQTLFSDPNKKLIQDINEQAKLNIQNAMKPMPLAQMQQPAQIQQVNLMDILKNMGGGY